MDTGDRKSLQFEKWHGTGNDFVICSGRDTLDCTNDVPELARKMCNRHFGIGSDGLILIGRSDTADFKMRMWNPDGSEAEMCGNGMRCVGGHLFGHGQVGEKSALKIETSTRIIELEFLNSPDWAKDAPFWIRLEMGRPVTNRAEIPVAGDGNSPVINEELQIPGHDIKVKFTGINFGNPHAVVFMDDVPGYTGVDDIPLRDWGPAIENFNDLFPERINVEFVEVVNSDYVKMRVWERGAGITLSCGSGAAAIQAACHLTGNASDKHRVDVPGGSLMTEYSRDGVVSLYGPAVKVFSGEWQGC